MLIDLNTFIKTDFIRKELAKSCITISNIEEADELVFNIYNGGRPNVIFEKTSLKSYCFSKIKDLCENVNIINCNSCMERFCESICEDSKLTIFDNLNQCRNIDILNLIKNRKGIIVC